MGRESRRRNAMDDEVRNTDDWDPDLEELEILNGK